MEERTDRFNALSVFLRRLQRRPSVRPSASVRVRPRIRWLGFRPRVRTCGTATDTGECCGVVWWDWQAVGARIQGSITEWPLFKQSIASVKTFLLGYVNGWLKYCAIVRNNSFPCLLDFPQCL